MTQRDERLSRIMEEARDVDGLCGGRRRQGGGGTCRRPAGWGTSHHGTGRCKLHGGATQAHVQHAQKITVARELLAMGVAVKTDPIRALLNAVSEAAGNVAFLRQQAAELGVDVIGHKYGASAGVGVYVVGEEARGIVALYGEWFDRLGKVAKMAVDAGVAKAQVEIAQQQADTLAAVVRRVLDGLDLTAEQRKIGRELAASEFRALAVGVPTGADAS